MESFEDLGLSPELTEILAAEGIEEPTPLQRQALPVVRRGHNLVGRAGPGAGTLVAWGAPLLERLAEAVGGEGDAEAPDAPASAGPRALVLTPTGDGAHRSAASLARLAQPLGLRVASASGSWVLPERADVLFGTPEEVLGRVREGRLSLGAVETVVVEQPTSLASLTGLQALETLFQSVDADAQRVVMDAPAVDARAREVREAVGSFLERHVRKAVTVPPGGDDPKAPARGSLCYRIVDEPVDEAGLDLVAELLEEGGLRHLAVFFRTDDAAADMGDFLALHGFGVGAPGDPAVPIWLAVDELSAREAMDGAGDPGLVGSLSWHVPPGPDALDRRHGGRRGGHALVLPRELPHLRDIARRTGYTLVAAPPAAESRVPDDLVETVERVARALEEEDVAAYLLVLETLFEDHDPAEVAAAAVALLRKRPRSAAAEGAASPADAASTPEIARGPAWAKLFVSIGRKDRAGPGDIVGAIAGETGVDGSKVGRIEIRDTFSIVEVQEDVAERVIRGLNGTTVKGRSVRADYDRGAQRHGTRSGRSGRGPRKEGGSRRS